MLPSITEVQYVPIDTSLIVSFEKTFQIKGEAPRLLPSQSEKLFDTQADPSDDELLEGFENTNPIPLELPISDYELA